MPIFLGQPWLNCVIVEHYQNVPFHFHVCHCLKNNNMGIFISPSYVHFKGAEKGPLKNHTKCLADHLMHNNFLTIIIACNSLLLKFSKVLTLHLSDGNNNATDLLELGKISKDSCPVSHSVIYPLFHTLFTNSSNYKEVAPVADVAQCFSMDL